MKREFVVLAIVVLSFSLMGAGQAGAVTSTANVTLSATISSSASLTLSNTTVTFNGGELPPSAMAAAENGTATVNATFRTASTAPATLKVQASGDLVDGNLDTISITNVKSSATGDSFFLSGPITWSKSAGVTVGSGQSGNYNGAFTWTLDNSWSYATGTYTSSATYTLSAP
jgi:hypothetical protein